MNCLKMLLKLTEVLTAWKKGGKINTVFEIMSVRDFLIKSFSFLAKISQMIEILSMDTSLIYMGRHSTLAYKWYSNF